MFPQCTHSEEWRPVVGYEGWYEVSNLGRVRLIMQTKGSAAGHVLKPGISTTGYPIVSLWRDNKGWTVAVHILVTQAFLGPCPPGQEVNHKDLDRRNARADNLEYLTRGDNVRHSLHNGTSRRRGAALRQGEAVNTAKLTEDDVRAIRASLEGARVLARRYGVSRVAVQLVRKGATWKHVV